MGPGSEAMDPGQGAMGPGDARMNRRRSSTLVSEEAVIVFPKYLTIKPKQDLKTQTHTKERKEIPV